MKIQRIETFCTREVGFVRVTTDDGAFGWGQVSTYHADLSALVLYRQVAPWVLGQSALDIGALADRVCECEHKFPGSHLYRAIGGLDTALWDLHGRLEGKPVCALLGGAPKRSSTSPKPLHMAANCSAARAGSGMARAPLWEIAVRNVAIVAFIRRGPAFRKARPISGLRSVSAAIRRSN